jgi:uncharacterized membrane protein YbhN (UPF0104 family)
VPPIALGESFESFFNRLEAFFESLAAIEWGPLLLGMLLHAGFLTLRSRGWFNTLRAAYPNEPFRWRNIWAAYVSAFGVNSVIPARPGGLLRLVLARGSIPNSSYAAVGSSFLVESVFDVTMSVLLVIFALTQGVLPDLPDLDDLPAFDLSWVASNPQLALFVFTVLVTLVLIAIAVLSVRVRAFWAHVRQGLVILRDRPRWLRHVVAWQLAGWLLRFTATWMFLEAFHIGGSVRNALIALAVQSLASLVPFTPNGAGAQQALLAVAFAGAVTGATLAAYAVGQQVVIAVTQVALGAAGLTLVFRTRDWRELVRRGREEQAAEKAAQSGARPA